MASTTVELSADAHATLAALAQERRRPMSELLAELIERERRRAFLVGLNEDFARLQADPAAWADDQAEVASMDSTLTDSRTNRGPHVKRPRPSAEPRAQARGR